jgi:hypothetical protein
MKQKFEKLFFALALLCAAVPASAQTRRQAKDSSVTITFRETSTTSKKKKASGNDNIIKIAPLGFITGVFPILYERRITDFLTVEVGGGLTNRNYVRGLFIRAGNEGGGETPIKEYPWGSTNDDVAEPLYSFEARKPQMGYMFRVEPRVYFESEAPEDNYIGLQYNYAQYKFQIPALVNGEHKGTMMNEHENITDFMVHLGRQWIFDRISVESSSAIGLRKVDGVKYVNNGQGVEGMAKYSKSTINFGLGFTVGYHF